MNSRRPAFRGPGIRRLWLALVLAAVTLAAASMSRAQESRVLLVHPETPSRLLSEALVHVRGEFGSAGLTTMVITTQADRQNIKPELAPGTYGALLFEERPGIIIMRAYHPESREPIIQTLSTRDGRITPHVTAVRAVETLRAALQQYYATNKQMPDPLKKIARIPSEPPAAVPPPQPPPRAPAPSPRSKLQVALWVAPAFSLDLGNAVPAGALMGALTVGRAWYFLGASLESTLFPYQLEAPSGLARVQRVSGALDFRGRLEVGPKAALFGRLGAGFSRYNVQGEASAGFESETGSHWTPILVMGVGAEYWFARQFGAFVGAQSSVAMDAPVVRFAGEPTDPLERPLLGLALGIVMGTGR